MRSRVYFLALCAAALPGHAVDQKPNDVPPVVAESWSDRALRETIRDLPDFAAHITAPPMNRLEYANAIRELLDLSLNFPETFPADGGYFAAAQQVLDNAIVSPPRQQRFSGADFRTPDGKPLVAGTLNEELDAAIGINILITGDYTMRVGAEAIGDEPVSVAVKVDGSGAHRFEAPAGSPTPESTVLQLPRGFHTIGLRGSEGAIRVTALEVTEKSLPPSATKLAAHARIFGGADAAWKQATTPEARRTEAAKLIAAFTQRAFRRPITSAERERILSLYDRSAARAEPFEESVKLALKLVLVSPQFLLRLAATEAISPGDSDPYLWLEDIQGEKALAWVKQHNEASAARLTRLGNVEDLHRDALAVLNSASRIPDVDPHGAYLYNLWQDAGHPRGLYRRTTLSEFRKENPQWETVLDVDALARQEGKPWAFNGAVWRKTDAQRCLIQLSPGGGDAVEVREFDAKTKAFVTGGFFLPTAKSRVTWRDDDTLFVATDFGPGSLTESGYPRIVKTWRRGTPLGEAQALYTGDAKSVSAAGRHLGTGSEAIDAIVDSLTFWTSKTLQVINGDLHELALPPTANLVDAFHGRLVVWLKEDWTVQGKSYSAGSVILVDPEALRDGTGRIETLVAGGTEAVVRDVDTTTDAILVTMLDNVRGRLIRYTPATTGSDKGWSREAIPFPDNGSLRVGGVNDETRDVWVHYESFTVPPTLYRVPANTAVAEKIKTQAPTFDGARFAAQQLWTTSADGTKIPYFVVGPKDLPLDGRNPAWMFSYGGFENALTPSYSGSYEDLHGAYGKLWLERGGVFVLANIRGGGEFGPQWHTSALKENHLKCFEDFEAVARDLVTRKITSPTRLGIEGRSNGGLLVAATMLRHPELYGAVVCGNPLVDMRRYHRLLAGASWVAEYGDPDRPDEWAYLGAYSPYQNVRAGLRLPPVMFYTSTQDDRVHPGHARKMMAKMEALGYAADYYENTEGGHHGSVTNEQLATRLARTYAFLWERLGAK